MKMQLASTTTAAAVLALLGRAMAAPAARTGTAASSSTIVVTTTAAGPAVTTTFGPTPTSCDLRYCGTEGLSWCVYWGGYTSYDLSQGRPVPGETRTAYATCSSA